MFEISMKDLFPKCRDILVREMRPIKYGDLTRIALMELGVPFSEIDLKKEKENVREKLLLAGQYNCFYTGAPLYAGAMRNWFVADDHQQLSLVVDYIKIPGNASAGASGAFEALMRSGYMQVHNRELANTELLNRGRASGLVIEKHVTNWFSKQYPEFFAEPENHNVWHQPCSYDFSLTVDGRQWKIDVAGPDKNGSYGKRGAKKSTHMHLLCKIVGDYCAWEGVVRGKEFNAYIDPSSIFSPVALIVRLNCAKHGINYEDVLPKRRAAA